MDNATDMQSTIDSVNQLITNIDSAQRPEAAGSQISPTSGKGSSMSEDSGIAEATSALERKSSQQSVKQDAVKRSTSRQHSTGSEISAVLRQLEQLIISDEWINNDQGDQQGVNLSKLSRESGDKPRLNELGRAMITSASLKAYIGLLGTHHRQSIAAWLYGNTSQTLCNHFRFPGGNLRCFESGPSPLNSLKSGIGHAVRLALRDVYGPEYSSRGWRAFADMGAPVVYLSPALRAELASYLSTEFAISDVIVLPKLNDDYSEVEGRIDYNAFEKQVEQDTADGKRPLLVIAVVGSTILGQNDMVSRLLEVRKSKSRFWLHVVGQGIGALVLKEPNEIMVQVLSQVDSMSFPLAQWLGLPAAPTVMLHRSVEDQKLTFTEKLDVLPWWIATQYLSPKAITDSVENAFYLSKMMLKGLSTFPQIQIMGIDNPIDFANKVYKARSMPPTALVFKYRHLVMHEGDEVRSSRRFSKDAKQEAERSLSLPVDFRSDANNKDQDDLDEYVRALNSWLCQGLLPNCRQLGLQVIEIGEKYGVAFRFCPLETAASNSTAVNHIQDFVKELSDMLKIIESTASARKRFVELATKCPSLVVVPIQKWAGVGAVCFVPSIVKETNPAVWYDQQRQQVSQLNIELVHSLRSVDSAFSLGQSSQYGVSCVKFGMLSDEKDLDYLLRLVSERGGEIEKSQQYMDSLAEMIRQGIEAANEDLKKENDARLMQEGVVRQIPLMGSLFNWLSPLDKGAQNIRGRSFDLKTGQIQATDVFYKNRLKEPKVIAEEQPQASPRSSPSPPASPAKDSASETNEPAEESK